MRLLSAFVLGAALGVGGILWAQYLEPSAKSEAGTVAVEVADKPKTTVACTPSTIYKDSAKADLDLPAEVVADKTRQVVAAIDVHAARHPHTITAVKDLDGGDTNLFVRHNPTAWLSFDHPKYVRAAYLYDNEGPVIRVGAGYGLFQIKALGFSLIADFDDRGDKAVGIEASAEF